MYLFLGSLIMCVFLLMIPMVWCAGTHAGQNENAPDLNGQGRMIIRGTTLIRPSVTRTVLVGLQQGPGR